MSQDKFIWKPGSFQFCQCQERKCKWFLGEDRCLAFPEGIPNEIAYGNHKHIVPYPGDHGIQFEKIKEDLS
jgi:hypothetical protein